MTYTLVIKQKADLHREQQQPSKLQSNFTSMFQALGYSGLAFFLDQKKEERDKEREGKKKVLTLEQQEHQLFWSSLQQLSHLSQKLPHQNLKLHKVFPLP